MTLWHDSAILGLYTLSPTHCGTGQTTGAVDLPIARDRATGFPVLPATSLKGVLRHGAENADGLKDKVKDLFGPEISMDNKDAGLTVGRLAVTEARLIAYPVRSLSRPFLHVTCPLILERLARDLRATGAGALKLPDLDTSAVTTPVRVADPDLTNLALVLEDLIYAWSEVRHDPVVQDLGKSLAKLIPDAESDTGTRLSKGLAVIPDADFGALMESAIPVQARIQLTSAKTTAEVNGESGNLWYEETLPADCLFAALIGERRSHHNGAAAGLGDLTGAADAFRVIQIGGNETVGQGLCLTRWVTTTGEAE